MQLQQHEERKEQQSLFGSLCPGQKKLLGKTFYLDSVKKRPTAVLLETIPFLGGGIESFLHKDVSFVVTGNQEGLNKQRGTDAKANVMVKSEESQHPIMSRERRPGTPRPVACGSRGKALLEKAIRNYEQLQKSSVLANARSWGVKILYVDNVISVLKQLARESLRSSQKKPEKTPTRKPPHVVKAVSLRSPYLKIEDCSRKYRPLHMQSMTFPSLQYLGRFSPFESPPPRKLDKRDEHRGNKTRNMKESVSSHWERPETPLSFSPSAWRPRKKAVSYCECCRQAFSNVEEHLQSKLHRDFVLDASTYSAVDQLVGEMFPGFDPDPPEQLEETLQPPDDGFDLDTLDEAEVEEAVRVLRTRGSSLGRCRSPVTPRSQSPSPGLLYPVLPPSEMQTPGSPTMPVLDAEPSVCDVPDTQEPPPFPDRLSPPPDLYAFPPVLSPQVFPHFEENHPLYSDPPVLSPQRCVQDDPISPAPSDASPPPLEEETAGSREEAEFRCSVSFLPGSGKRQRPSSPEPGWSKRCKNPNNVALRRFDWSSSEGGNTLLRHQSRDVGVDAPLFVPATGLATSLSIESALIPNMHRLSSPSSDSDWDSGLLSRLGPTPAEPLALPEPTAAAPELDTELLHRPCAFMQDSGYESRLHTVLQPQAAPGVRVGAGPRFGQDVDSSSFSRTLVKIVEVTH